MALQSDRHTLQLVVPEGHEVSVVVLPSSQTSFAEFGSFTPSPQTLPWRSRTALQSVLHYGQLAMP